MRLPIPSTLQAALSIMGKAESKELQTGVKLVRDGDDVSLSVDGSDIVSFSMDPDTSAQSVTLALGPNPTSRMVGIARVALSATGSWIRKTSDKAVDRQRQNVLALLDKAQGPEDIAMIQRLAAGIKAGLVFYAPATGAKPLSDGITVPVLA